MENKTKHEWERDLLLKLREVVSEKEEFDYVEAELASLGFFETGRVFDGQPIDTIAASIEDGWSDEYRAVAGGFGVKAAIDR
jgi:hypothetical protein